MPTELFVYTSMTCTISVEHGDVIKCKHFPRYWPFVRGIHRSHKGQWRGALMLSLICAWINGWVNNRETGDLRRHRAHYDVIVMMTHGNIHWKPGSCDDNLRYPKRKRLAAWQLLVFSVLVSCGLKLWLNMDTCINPSVIKTPRVPDPTASPLNYGTEQI